jgi:hypothetical protein
MRSTPIMITKIKDPVNVALLSKKYKCDIKKLIKGWKLDKSDYEISLSIGVELLKILQIRQEITFLHERERHKNSQKKFPSKTSLINKPW